MALEIEAEIGSTVKNQNVTEIEGNGRARGLGLHGRESTGSVKGGSTNPVVTAEGVPRREGRPGRVAGVGLPFEPSVLLNADFFTLVDF